MSSLVFLLRTLTILLTMLISMFAGFCVPNYIAMKQSKNKKPKLIDVINFSTYVIYKIITKGGKL